jgi:hypothetical protein
LTSCRYLVHLSTLGGTTTAAESLAPVLSHISSGDPLLAVYYDQASDAGTSKDLPRNVVLCQPPDLEVGYGGAIKSAEGKFDRLFPGHLFLPSVPPVEDEDDD